MDGSIDTKNNIKVTTFSIVIKYENEIYEYSGKVVIIYSLNNIENIL